MAHVTEILLVTSTVAVLTFLVFAYWKKNKKVSIPTIWDPVAKVKKLFLYPIKSGNRIELESAICTKYGVRVPNTANKFQISDRSFIVYKDDFVFITGRQHPKLIFIELSVLDDKRFALNAPNMPEVVVPVPEAPRSKKFSQVTIHRGEKINTIDCGNEVAKWLSTYILDSDKGLRLGFYDYSFRRDITKPFKNYFKFYPRLSNEATGMYSDLSSYLLINQASVNELSNRIPESHVTEKNFRPNILIEDENLKPFEEDDWRWIKIGDVVFYMARYCTRCIFTTVNPETGIKSDCNEPLRTLRTYRLLRDISNIRVDGDLTVMGLNLGLAAGGVINVGDTVYVGRSSK